MKLIKIQKNVRDVSKSNQIKLKFTFLFCILVYSIKTWNIWKKNLGCLKLGLQLTIILIID